MSQHLHTRDEIGAYFIDALKVRDLGRGIAFPTVADGVTLQAGDRFFRTDLLWTCVYDGTRWLTTHEYPWTFPLLSGVSASANGLATRQSMRADYRPYVTRFDVWVNIGATNNSSNYWKFQLRSFTPLFVEVTTQATGTNLFDVALGTSVITSQPSGAIAYVNLAVEKVGTPSNIEYWAAGWYRFVVP